MTSYSEPIDIAGPTAKRTATALAACHIAGTTPSPKRRGHPATAELPAPTEINYGPGIGTLTGILHAHRTHCLIFDPGGYSYRLQTQSFIESAGAYPYVAYANPTITVPNMIGSNRFRTILDLITPKPLSAGTNGDPQPNEPYRTTVDFLCTRAAFM